MDFKKIKNYLVLAVLVLAGILSLWNGLGNDDSDTNETSEIIEQIQETVEDITQTDPDVQSNEDHTSQTDNSTVDTEESVSTEADVDDYANQLYENALNYIKDYPGITDVWWVEDAPDHVQASYHRYNDDGWTGLVDGQSQGTKAGGRFGNYEGYLPKKSDSGDSISYREFDVNDKISGSSRDAERFVIGDDGSVYYTDDHYDSFVQLIE